MCCPSASSVMLVVGASQFVNSTWCLVLETLVAERGYDEYDSERRVVAALCEFAVLLWSRRRG